MADIEDNSMTKPLTIDELREVWALVSDKPGISVRQIGRTLGISHYRSRQLVDDLTIRGKLIKGEKGTLGKLRAATPLLTLVKGR